MQKTHGRGRPAGSRAGKLKSGERLNILETLRAAAPWQRLRRDAHGRPPADNPRIIVKATDFRIQKRKHPAESATIFAVDASGSHALHRLAEAKGAIELLLSQCYVRRDRVALVSFRGKSADVLLSPTRSLARAKRTLSSLPGGGATPLAAGLDVAAAIALQERKRGASPTIVVLTDGKANVDRLGNKSRSAGEADALAAGRGVRAIGLRALLVDTSPQRHVQARALAEAMGARYLPLPHADAAAVTHAVRLAVEVG
jgi:magnesium chelatase subunit D